MKHILLTLIIPLILGCEEIIEVDINSTDPQIIIEASLSDSIEKNFVRITRSTDFYNPNEYDKISNAEVVISDENNTSYKLEEIVSGTYTHPTLKAAYNNNYFIEVNYQGTSYSAASFAPSTIKIDSLSYKLEPRPFKEEKRFELHVHFNDNAEQDDYARIVVYKNGEKINKIFLYNDRLTNGNVIDYFFFNFEQDEKFGTGDVITAEMHTLDKQTFTYFNTLRNALAASTGGPFGPAAPANPTNNWSNGALGYFSAFTTSSSSIVIE